MENEFNAVYAARPTETLCDRTIKIDVVGNRCIYLNNHRIVGAKPYVSENLPEKSKELTVRDALDAFSVDDLSAYIREKIARKEYFADYRAKSVDCPPGSTENKNG